MKHSFFLLLLISSFSRADLQIHDLFHKWTGVSTNIYSIYGDMTVSDSEIAFSKSGDFEYDIIQILPDSVLIKLSKPFDCGDIIRLGPLEDSKYSAGAFELEFSVYRNEQEAFKPKAYSKYHKKIRYPMGCSWGVYMRNAKWMKDE